MSDELKEEQDQAGARSQEKQQPLTIHEQLRNLKRKPGEPVRFVKMSGLGPIPVHSTGASETKRK